MVMDKLTLKCGVFIDLVKLRAGKGEPREEGDVSPGEERNDGESQNVYK